MDPMKHVVQGRLVGRQLITRLKQTKRSPMGRSTRIYEDQMIPRVANQSRSMVDVGARNSSVEGVVLCEAPNDRGRTQ
jgi:hypothetical protein